MATNRVKVIWESDTKGLDRADKSLKKTNKSTDQLNKETQKYKKEIKDTGDKGSQAFKNIGAAIAAIGIAGLVREITNITAEFQKLGAVLVNTLGSRSKAQQVLKDIATFASQTPFAVKELTDGFVKLANQGFAPTLKQLGKLGDLAASTGKSFDQLSEAIIDAQVGEFERLKEFGIRSSKQGDQVIFTFKGVQKQVEFTETAIQDYLLSLGDVSGVTGAMASISKTTAGQISNLGDSFDALFFTIGDGNKFINGTLSLISQLTQELTALISVPYSETLMEQRLELQSLAGILKDNLKDEELRGDIIDQINQRYPEFLANMDTESLTIKQIDDRLKELNREYEKRIILQLQEEANLPLIQESVRLRGLELEQLKRIKDIEEGRIPQFIKVLGEEHDQLEAANTVLNLYRRSQEKLANQIADNNAKYQGLLQSYKDVNLEEEKAVKTTEKKNKVDKDKLKLAEKYRDMLLEIRLLQQQQNEEAERSSIQDITPNLSVPSIDEILAESDEVFNKITKKEQDTADAAYDIWKELYENRKELERSFAVAGLEIVEMFLLSQNQVREADFEALSEQKENDLALAGDNADAKLLIEQQYAEKEKKLKQQQAEAEKRALLKQILITNALGVAKAIASAPPPLNIVPIAIQTALGLAQYAIAKSTPAFKDGVIDLQGPGTGTSDSIVARLSAGESVIRAASTKRSKRVLEAIEAGQLDDKTYKLLMQGVPAQSQGAIFDSKPIVDELRKNRPPDYFKVGNDVYELRQRGLNTKERIRKKMIN